MKYLLLFLKKTIMKKTFMLLSNVKCIIQEEKLPLFSILDTMSHNAGNIFKFNLLRDILSLHQIFLRCDENSAITKVLPAVLGNPLLHSLI